MAKVKKAEFHLSGEVDFAKWFKAEEALPKIRKGSVAYRLVSTVCADLQAETLDLKGNS